MACLVLSGPASASFITFETRPDGSTPLDDEIIALGTGYTTNDGVTVTFGFDTNNDGIADLAAAFEDTLDEDVTVEPEYGYCSSNYGSFACTADQAAPGFEDQLGDFFIRSAGAAGTHWDSFIIEYDAPTAVTRGQHTCRREHTREGMGNGEWGRTAIHVKRWRRMTIMGVVGVRKGDMVLGGPGRELCPGRLPAMI